MFYFPISDNMLLAVILLLVLCGITLQIIISIFLKNLIAESQMMGQTSDKRLSQCKLKYISCYELNGGLFNTKVYVAKFVGDLTICKKPLSVLAQFSGQMILLAVFVSGLGICKGIVNGSAIMKFLPYYILAAVVLYVYFSAGAILDLSGKKKTLETNLIDFLDNSLAKRVFSTQSDVSRVREFERDNEIKRMDSANQDNVRVHISDAAENRFNKENEEELESLLRELF